ncbi:MAG: peptidase T [Deltaproteobacteria bacterium]|nr:peptidase T [Deltaproteobacteria bacterium]
MTQQIFNNPDILINETTIVERFLSYVKINTTSDPSNNSSPSTPGQKLFAKQLVDELLLLGLNDASVDNNGYVTATLPGSTSETLGLIAHLDTSDAFSGSNVTPIIHENYDGTDIYLKNEIIISPNDDKHLAKCIGHTIITTDGTTLLGADDKAGIALIMGLLEYLKKYPMENIPTIKIAFTPDEEIGRGASKFPYDTFGSKIAFTVDGTFAGEINFETFEAYSVSVNITGVSIHPGQAYGKLVNALRSGAKLIERLPEKPRPENTKDREGFIHPISFTGDSTSCTVQFIVRDFEEILVKELCDNIELIADALKNEEPGLSIETKVEFSYPNMYKYIRSHDGLAQKLKQAVISSGIKPVVVPVRGGTDGSGLSMNGIITPNIFTGAVNLHGPKEWISVKNMGYSLCTLLNLVTNS